MEPTKAIAVSATENRTRGGATAFELRRKRQSLRRVRLTRVKVDITYVHRWAQRKTWTLGHFAARVPKWHLPCVVPGQQLADMETSGWAKVTERIKCPARGAGLQHE